jgi:hypothetical protein
VKDSIAISFLFSISEFCSPVVVTLASGEAERVCLQNGLLLHELLSCFGHLIDVSANIRIGKQAFSISETHLRFERATEVKPKSAELMESVSALYHTHWYIVHVNSLSS